MFAGIRFNSSNLKIDFIRMRFINYIVSGLITVACIGAYFINDLNYGIDFSGGTLMEVRFPSPINLPEIRQQLNDLDIGDVSLQEFGTSQDLLIRLDQKNRSEKEQLVVIEKIKETLDTDVEYRRIESVGPKMGEELISNSFQAVGWAILAMMIYIWVRFEWNFGVCAIIALLHDAVAVLGLYTVFGLEFNASTIVAILITISYSINDTVVIYDRIRENLRKYKITKLEDLINKSINDTLTRTILTSTSTLLSLLFLYLFGGKIISEYSLPILIGIAVGTYSSICLAAPLLLTLGMTVRQKEDESPSAYTPS
ncbi:MAG: protein-export membrane protein SecF [Alphaproteobacteria bacterium RIFCSPLOWO2_01_FULL_45_8]|nr:MAG: protein-export membrane protein SecF [Alphaproteobacteria bacterium GWA1_45_9]OFW89335.1 MAG: protein-export membrane protein SecF [Alphaproteobacteria bacterium RIFCSPHIGHO2_01_FULL_41_14]OFW96148.1 MAG: protein-export membrane protein SecF [Alphaproteobacteria bacterium RIFCSPLOWO2_01_FULL_45_8]